MSSTCCSQCCLAYLCCCCPQLGVKPKYAEVNYSTVKDSLEPESDENHMSSSLVDTVDKLFTFPQQQTDSPLHPQMFNDGEVSNPVTEQPSARRFSVQSLTGADYEQCVTGLNAEVRKELKHSVSLTDSPRIRRFKSLLRSHSIDSPLKTRHRSPLRSVSTKATSLSTALPKVQQHVSSETESESPWVIGIPIVEESTITGQSDKPTLQFSLYYDIQLSTLTVHLHRASNLPAKDQQGTSDPFIVLHLTPNKEETFQSTVIYRTLNPVFDQSFEFRGLTPDEIRRQTLIIRIYDHDRFTHNDSIGMVALPLENADLYGVVMRMMIQDNEEEVR